MRFFAKVLVAAFAVVAVADPTCRAALGHVASAAKNEVLAESRTTVTTGTAAAVPAASNAADHYTLFHRNSDGSPVRWNPCATIHVVVNLANAPAGALTDVRAAVAKESAASGLNIVVDGTTTIVPTPNYPTKAYPGRHGWAPVLIAWGRPGTGPLGADGDDGASGVGMPAWVDTPHGSVYVSGLIVLNSDQNALYNPGFGPGHHVGVLIEHELGHILGLDHYEDPAQVMNPTVGGAAGDLGAGDRAGLHLLGQGGCISVPNPGF